MDTIVFIPVRGGSKSIPLKNIKEFCEKPLVFWAAQAAQNASLVDKVVIATDSPEIKSTVLSFGFNKLQVYDRDPANADDTASTESVILEYLKVADIDRESKFILIQATSPYITSIDIDNGLNQLSYSKKDSLLSCALIKRFLWTKNGKAINYNYQNRPRRQDFEGQLMENGAFYINSVGNILEFKNRLSGAVDIYKMPEFTMTEIDEPDDWFYAEYIMRKYILNRPLKSLNIKLVLSDVDGVLTDAGMYYSEFGDELKKFNTHDGKGFEILRSAGFKTGIITSENTNIVERRAKKLKVDFLYQGKEHGGKLQAALAICGELSINLDQVAYIGDDINCLELLQSCGLAACPSNAVSKIKSIPGIIRLGKSGGAGAFRDFADHILVLNNQDKI